MRQIMLAVTLLIAPLVWADNQVSVFVTPQSVTHSNETGTDFSGGVGASLNVFWNQRWSTELTVATEQSYESATTTINTPNGPITTVYENRVHSYPIDALAQYHFVNPSKWTPYAGAGLRYLPKPNSDFAETRTSAEINAGVVWQFSPRWGLTFDIRQLLREDVYYDRSTKGSFGFSWSH